MELKEAGCEFLLSPMLWAKKQQHPEYVCKLIQSLYGMHQSGHNWHNLIDEDLVRHGVK